MPSGIDPKTGRGRGVTHGMSHTRFYNIWVSAKKRCLTKTNPDYFLYGGRGIKVCQAWLKFENFRDDMHQSYLEHVKQFGEKQTTIDRINNNGNYELANCRWATLIEQGNNRRDNKLLTFEGKTLTLIQWSREKNIEKNIIYNRKSEQKNNQEILQKERLQRTKITFNGKTQDIVSWSRETGIEYYNIWNRICNLNWSVERALTTIKKRR